MSNLYFAYILLSWLTLLGTAVGTASIVMTMLCRDEDVNLKANIPNWLRVVDYFVFVVDNRTRDSSLNTIENLLGKVGKKYKVVNNDFTGFGPARTLSLDAAWTHFPQATHVLIADPDWQFDLKTINKNELDLRHDVFRFTIYDAQRSGKFHTRKMDWLLRNRPGLSMKYHLHEVLSIGDYIPKMITWEVREIAKTGTWHETVGHGESDSANRYKSDLALLYRDLEMYNHDPHTHYYLGSTHENYAEKAQHTLGLDSEEVQGHIDRAIQYYELRARSAYDDELLEQRWAALIGLGNIYTSLKRDELKAIYWLNTCHDFQPKYVECPLLLCQSYISVGQLAPALAAMDTMLRTEEPPVRVSSYLGLWECDVPLVVLDTMVKKIQMYGASAEEAMYFLLLHQARQKAQCKQPISTNRSVRTILNAAVGARNIDYFETPHDFCTNAQLQQYLVTNKYAFHPCGDFKKSLQLVEQCEVFTVTAAPAYEEFQAGSLAKHFIGEAILPDIIHHVFQGDRAKFLAGQRTLRFLFAEHFHPLMVLNLLGQLKRANVTNFEIVVVSAVSAVHDELSLRIKNCQQLVTRQQLTSKITSLQAYLVDENAREEGRFDYIEYNGGLSKVADPVRELTALQRLLHAETGVLGLTYFTQNHHTTRVRALVDARNTSFMAPFSLEATRLVHAYLDQHKLGLFKTDRELVTHLGGEINPDARLHKLAEVKPRVQWRTYTHTQSEQMLAVAGLMETSRLPTAYTQPFGEIKQFEVQKFRAFGLSEEHFTQDLMPSFRNTIYAVRKKDDSVSLSPSTIPLGRRTLTLDVFNRSIVPEDVFIIDRVHYLSRSFQNMEDAARHRTTPSIEFTHYALPGDTRVSYVISPMIAACLPAMSSRPSLRSLHEMNKQFAVREKLEFVEVEAQSQLLELMLYLEKLNLITYEVAGVAGASAHLPEKSEGERRNPETKGPVKQDETPEFVGKGSGLGFKIPTTATAGLAAVSESLKSKIHAQKAESQSIEVNAHSEIKTTTELEMNAKRVPLSRTEQVTRMRALGYDEETIADLLEDEEEEEDKEEKTGAPVGVQEVKEAKEGKSAQSIIDLLTRFTTTRAKKTNVDSTEAADNKQSHVEKKASKIATSADPTPVLTFQVPNKAGNQQSELIIGGGLKLPQLAKVTQKGPTDVLSKPAKSAIPVATLQKESDVLKRSITAQNIKMPNVQTPGGLQKSHRSLHCLSDVSARNSECREPKSLKRKTAHATATSARKIEFDTAQLKYLQSQSGLALNQGSVDFIGALGTSYNEVANYLKEFKLDDPYRVVRLNSNSALKSKTSHLNRLLHLEPDTGRSATDLVHAGAMNYLHSIRGELQTHDFIVVDVILKEAAQRELSRLLLSSTVWFDATNGAAFAAFSDESLAFPTIHNLVQQVALALSSDERPLSVTGYYSLAMGLQRAAYSPVFMANNDDLNVVLWLNPHSPASEFSNAGSDGLRIYDESSASKLFSQGVSVYPSAHSDFLSRSSSLAIDLQARCNLSNSEFIPRAANRLVVVRAKKLCTLLTPGYAEGAKKDFEQSTMIALVMVLSPSA